MFLITDLPREQIKPEVKQHGHYETIPGTFSLTHALIRFLSTSYFRDIDPKS